ncbi:hypothetical protein [Parerythrobacter lacustris]|uniref:Uncharacterized protein n=1 Tax=Parerythrobacter lacustris TaxID=2969984 RepID=A0ABT1XNI4_9SPHN|nr:hypothetical protein [Parerythrobacter lacustris]MCR2833210.1 hypothetical protein [Parerythrobacter lacustris]
MTEVANGGTVWAIALGGASAFLALVWLGSRIVRVSGGALYSLTLPLMQRLDSWFARSVAGWCGLDRARRWHRWGQFAGLMLLLSALGAIAPVYVALPTLLAGLVGVIGVFRRWSWDESDRAAGLRADRKRIPGHEDYNDELIIALSAVFLIGPVLIWRLTGLTLFTSLSDGGLAEYVVYIGSETLESLPIVGNVEVLGYANPSGVSAVLPSGGWVAFGLRMLLDLMVIGGLIKVAEVARRISRREDLRRQDEAIATGDDAAAYAAIEVLGELMLRGEIAAADRLQAIAAPGADDPPQSLRRRLQAAYMIELAADGGAFAKQTMLTFLVDAYARMSEMPELESTGLAPVLYLQASRANGEFAERLSGPDRANALDAAIAWIKLAIECEGLIPISATYRPVGGETRDRLPHDAILMWEILGGQMINRAEVTDIESKPIYLANAIQAFQEATRLIPKDVVPHRWAAAQIGAAQALYKLAVHDYDLQSGINLGDAVDLLEDAQALVEPDGPHGGIWLTGEQTRIEIRSVIAERVRGEEGMAQLIELEQTTDTLIATLRDPERPLSARFRTNRLIEALTARGHILYIQSEICEETPTACAISSAGPAPEDAHARALRAVGSYREAAEAAAASELWNDWQTAMDRAAELLEVHAGAHGYDPDTAEVGTASIRQAVSLRKAVLARINLSSQPWHWAFSAVSLARAQGELSQQTGDTLAALAAVDLARQAAGIFDDLGYVDAAEEARELAARVLKIREYGGSSPVQEQDD